MPLPTAIRIGVLGCLASLPALAEWTAPLPGNGQPIPVVEQGLSSRAAVAGIATNATYQIGANQGLLPNDAIRITLTGGAVWSSTRPTLTPSAGSLGLGTAATTPVAGGFPGQNFALWRAVDSNIVPGETLTLNSDQSIYNLLNINGPVDLQISLISASGLPLGPQNQSLNATLESTPQANDALQFTVVDLTTITANTGTPTTDTAQVVDRYRTFENGATSTTTAAFNVAVNSSAAGIPNTGIDAGQLVYTIKGDFTGIASVSGSGVTGSDSEGNQEGGTAGEFTIDREQGMAWASNSSAIPTGSNLTYSFNFDVDGKTRQNDRAFKLEAKIVGNSVYSSHIALPAETMSTIDTNGTRFMTNALGANNSIKITDRSGTASQAGGEIEILAYDKDGDLAPQGIAGSPLPGSLGNYETVTISGADLLEHYPTGVVFEFSVNTESATVSNIKRSAEGVNITVLTNGEVPAL